MKYVHSSGGEGPRSKSAHWCADTAMLARVALPVRLFANVTLLLRKPVSKIHQLQFGHFQVGFPTAVEEIWCGTSISSATSAVCS